MEEVGSEEKSPEADSRAPALEMVTIVSYSPFPCRGSRRKILPVVHVILRVLCLLSSVVSLCVMVTAQQSSTLSLFGFQLPVYSKWSLSDSFQYLVGVSAAVAAHSLLQLLISLSRLQRKVFVVPSPSYAWLLYAGDQVFAYATMSAGSAASGVTSLNRTGIKHSSLPNFCNPLHTFCDRVGISIAFTFFSCFLLAASTVLDVIWLTCFNSEF